MSEPAAASPFLALLQRAADAGGAWRVRVPALPARSAVGSGDAFAAGLTLGLLRNQPLPAACAFGAACGAANAMTDLAGHLTRQDVERVHSQVRVEPIWNLRFQITNPID